MMIWLFEVFLFLVIPSWIIYFISRFFFIKKFHIHKFAEILRLITIAYLNYLIYIVWLKPTATMEYLPINLIPFKTISVYFIQLFNGNLSLSIVISNLIGNIILTLPIGILLPLNFKNITFKKIFLIAIISPLIIESVQLLLHLFKLGTRSIDIDDVILNFIGTIVGYFISHYLSFHNQPFNSKSKNSLH